MSRLHETRLLEVNAFHNRKCNAVNKFYNRNVGLFHSHFVVTGINVSRVITALVF